jgi:hypothetical protein
VITSYSELQTAVGNWLQRAHLNARIPEFIELAEARFRRKLNDVEQETVTQITLVSGSASLPANFGGLIAVRDIATGRLSQVSPSQFDAYEITSGDPVVFAIVGDTLKAMPQNAATLELTYKLGLPSLSNSVTTNWLLTRAPDLYLFSTLLQAEFFGWNDERLPLIKAAADEMISELVTDSERRKYGPAPLAPRVNRT